MARAEQTKKAIREAAKWKKVQALAKRDRDSRARRELRHKRAQASAITLLLWLLGIGGALAAGLWLLW